MPQIFLSSPPDAGGIDYIRDDAPKTVANNPIIYPFLQRLEGYKTNLKGHHWHGYNNSSHVRIDEFLSIVSNVQDVIAEASMSIYGIMPCGFTAIPSENWGIKALTQEIINDVTYVHSQLEMDKRNIGLVNALEDFIQQANQHRYLIELSLCSGHM